MHFNLEKVDVSKLRGIYFLRGYEKQEDDHYCTSMVLLLYKDYTLELNLFLSKKLLSAKNLKMLLKYLFNQGVRLGVRGLYANVLRGDFDRFYKTKDFERVKLEIVDEAT